MTKIEEIIKQLEALIEIEQDSVADYKEMLLRNNSDEDQLINFTSFALQIKVATAQIKAWKRAIFFVRKISEEQG
tara:strand:- start:410 stop:634 length:225 start_codon:yes stop_codon:yes gene_type:complete